MIDLNKIAAPPGAEAEIATRRVISNIPLRKPKKTEFFQIRPGEEWTLQAYMTTLGDQEEDKYLVLPGGEAAPLLQEQGLLKRVQLFTGITYGSGVVFISEVALSEIDGNWNEYNRSRYEAYQVAMEKWVKIVANQESGSYERIEPLSNLPDPVWPEQPTTLQEALNLAFKDRVIEDLEHPRIKELRGELL